MSSIHNKMKIQIKAQHNITLEVEATDSVDTIKEKYSAKIASEMSLFFEGIQLEGGRTLSSYNIPNGSQLTNTGAVENLAQDWMKLRVYVRNSLVETFDVEVKYTDTITDIKNKIQKEEPYFCIDDFCLLYNGKELNGEDTLMDYYIEPESVLDLVRNSGTMKIFVNKFNKKAIVLEVEPTDTLKTIKEKLEANEEIPKVQQLFFDGQKLEDDTPLWKYKISDYSTLDLLEPQQQEIHCSIL